MSSNIISIINISYLKIRKLEYNYFPIKLDAYRFKANKKSAKNTFAL